MKQKCLCGYIHETELFKKEKGYDKVTTHGDEAFIEVNGNFTRKTDYHLSSITEVQVYACPKCGTLKMEV